MAKTMTTSNDTNARQATWFWQMSRLWVGPTWEGSPACTLWWFRFVIGADRCRLLRIGVVVAVPVDNCCLYMSALSALAQLLEPSNLNTTYMQRHNNNAGQSRREKQQPTNTTLSAFSFKCVVSIKSNYGNQMSRRWCKHKTPVRRVCTCVTYDRTEMFHGFVHIKYECVGAYTRIGPSYTRTRVSFVGGRPVCVFTRIDLNISET